MGDPVFDFLNSGGTIVPHHVVNPPNASPSKPQSSNDPVFDFLNSGGVVMPEPAVRHSRSPSSGVVPQAQTAPTSATEEDTGPLLGVMGNALTNAGASIVGGWHGLATLVSGGTLDDAANSVRDEIAKGTYQPDEGSSASKALGVLYSDGSPLTLLPRTAKWAGEKVQDAGASSGVAAGVETALNALAPIAIAKAGKGVRPSAKESTHVRIEPTLNAPKSELSGAEIEYQAARAKVQAATDWEAAQRDLSTALRNPETSEQAISELQAKAAQAEKTVKQLELTPETGRPRVEPPGPKERPASNPSQFISDKDVDAEIPKFLEGPPESATTVDQAQRAKTLRRIGIERVRRSAVEGNGKDSATDYQVSRLDNAEGKFMHSALQEERNALENYSEGLVRDTGGTVGMGEDVKYSRGNTILAPFDTLKKWYDSQIKGLYAEANDRAKGIPIDATETRAYLGEGRIRPEGEESNAGGSHEFLGTTEGESLMRGINARMKSLGMVDAEGNPQPVTVKQAEQLKQYLNNQWQPRTSRLIAGMKDAIDDDVTQAAGSDVYEAARALRAKRARFLDDPHGISKVMDYDPQNPMNRAVPVEKIPDTITGMPVEQLKHIVKTLSDVPPELKPQADAALAEIKAQFANKIHETGKKNSTQWAARDVSKYLNSNAAKLKQVFTPEELDKFNDLNNAGHILAKDQSYPGAAVQEHNLVQRGAMASVRAGTTAFGSAIGGPPGAAAGGLVGDIAAKALGGRMSLKSGQKRVIKLSDFPGVKE